MTEQDNGTEKIQEIHMLRGQCIDRYAKLEHLLQNIFSWLMNDNPAVSDIVFSKLKTSRSRNELIKDVFGSVLPQESKIFIQSLTREIAKADEIRNKIVHWHLYYRTAFGTSSEPPSKQSFEPFLKNPNPSKTSSMEKTELIEFIQRVTFLTKVTTIFQISIIDRHQNREQAIAATRDFGCMLLSEICQEQLQYHPLPESPFDRFVTRA